MTAITHKLDRDCVNSLGIPVDNLTLDSAVDRIVTMAKLRDGKARLVSTLNVDFLVNSLGTRFSRARHPELLEVLRNSDMVTADGFPILWLSKIVGKPLRQRVCGSDLVPALARCAGEQGLSLFLLGGAEGLARRAAERLVADNPGLEIAGTAAPMVRTAGPGLAECLADDAALVDQINQSGANILLLGLGNPKQELWYNRNKSRLQVPVSIGVGGTFEFITGGVKRAPQWVQRSNLEWVFRIAQDPARLWRRYAKGLTKLALLSAPLIAARAQEKISFFGRRTAGPEAIRWRQLWSSRDQSLAVIRLPPLVGASYLESLVSQVEDGAGVLRLIDFSQVRRIEMAGHQALFTLSELQRKQGNILLLGIASQLNRQLASCRVLDILGRSEGNALARLDSGFATQDQGLSCRSYVLDDAALIFLAGRVSAQSLAEIAFLECLQHTARDRRCIIDLRNVSVLESSAIAVLEPLIKRSNTGRGSIVFSGASDNTRQMFRVTGLDTPVSFSSDKQLMALISDGAQGHGGKPAGLQ